MNSLRSELRGGVKQPRNPIFAEPCTFFCSEAGGKVGEAEEGMSKEGIRTFSQPGGRGRIPLNFYGMRGTRAHERLLAAEGNMEAALQNAERPAPHALLRIPLVPMQCIIHRIGRGSEIYKTMKT